MFVQHEGSTISFKFEKWIQDVVEAIELSAPAV